MISRDSRYAAGKLVREYNAKTKEFPAVVYREFPSETTRYFLYVWEESDRIDQVAKKFLGHANQWWKILDFNPEILYVESIRPGTVLRIPNG